MTRKRSSPLQRAWAALRKGDVGKADAVFVVRLYAKDDGSWTAEGEFQHWLKDVPEQYANTVLPGVPAAVMGLVSGYPLQKHLGKILQVGTQNLAPVIGESAAAFAGELLKTFTEPERS